MVADAETAAYLTGERIAAAVEALAAVELGRADARLIRWLLFKRIGLHAGGAVDVTSDAVRSFTSEYFRYDVDANYGYFIPFGRSWTQKSQTTDWAVQVVYTQVGRLGQNEQPLYRSQRVEDTTPAVFRVTANPEAEYLRALSKLLPREKRVPATELALWRFRSDALPADVTESSLTERLLVELNITDAEFGLIFT